MSFARLSINSQTQFRLTSLALAAILAAGTPGLAQNVAPDDRPAVEVPKQPTQKELDRKESLYKYAEGLQLEKDGRLVAALQAFREAARLDPEAAPVFKAQVPILLAMNLPEECLAAITRVVELDPADTEAFYIQGRVCKMLRKTAEARTALQQGLATRGAKDRPELAHQMNFDLGGLFEAEKSYKQAAEAFTEAARILEHPEHRLVLGLKPDVIRTRIAEVHERLGNLYTADRQFDKAIASFKKFQEVAPEAAGRVSINLAQIYTEQGKSPEALTAIEAYLAGRPQGTEGYEMKIKLLEKLGRAEQVLPWLEQTCRSDPNNNSLRLLLANRCIQAKQFDRAERVYLDMHVKSPNRDVYQGLFRIYKMQGAVGLEKLLTLLNRTFEQTTGPGAALAMQQGRPMVNLLREDETLARDLIRHSLQITDKPREVKPPVTKSSDVKPPAVKTPDVKPPDTKFFEVKRKDLRWQTVQYLAMLAERHRQLESAEWLYRDCLKRLEPSINPEVQGGLMIVLRKLRKFDEVEKICRERVDKAEGQDRIIYLDQLSGTLSSMEKYAEALAAIDEAIKIASDNRNRVLLQLSRVRTLIQKGDFKQAEDECQAMLKATIMPSEMVEIHLTLSNVYNAARQMDKSEEELQWVLRFDPQHGGASNDLGYLWADQNRNLKEAEEMIRRALDQDKQRRIAMPSLTREEDQDRAAYVDSLGWVLFRKGDVQAARKELERATSLPDGENAEIWDHLGDVYENLRMYKEARQAWQRGVQLHERDNIRAMDDRYRNLLRKAKTPIPSQ